MRGESGNLKAESRDHLRMALVSAGLALAMLAAGFGLGNVVGEAKARNRQAPCAQVALADRYELRETGVVGLMLRLDKQTGETVPVSAMSSR
jgi:hypothetical protein